MNFCHLHLHNEFSFLDGYGSAKAYAKRAKELGFTHMGLTNHANIDGSIRFQDACKKEGIIPIHGCEFYIVPDEFQKIKGEKRGHITVLVKDEQGWQNLCQMLTIANLDGFYYRPRIGYKNFLEHCQGLVVLTGCSSSILLKDPSEKSLDFLSSLYEKIGSDLYLEVMPHQLDGQEKINILCLNLKDQTPEMKLVATNDCHYILPEDSEAQEVLLAIQTKAKWSDPDRFQFTIKGLLYLTDEQEMCDKFIAQNILSDGQIEEALDSTMEIAKKCKFQIAKKDISLPKLPIQNDVKSGDFIWDLAFAELHRIGDSWPAEKLELYAERLEEEWKLVNEKNFSRYFVIVWELVAWCKKNKILTGPARGSAGGSLLAYLLGITTAIDPIEYGLLFARFISPDRIDYPDIDIDFEDAKRHQIREHLESLYGKDHISSLSTFFTMKGRGCIRDVARVFDVPLSEVDEFAKTIDAGEEWGSGGSIESAAKDHWFCAKYPKIIELAIKLEGQVRGAGQHAAAVIVSGENLREGSRGNLVMRSEEAVANWDMKDSEYIGLMKLDILGLNTLSVLNEAKRLIELKQKEEFKFEEIPLDDDRVYQSLYEGKTNGVFQFSTRATTNLAKQIRAKNIFDLADIIALVRPGPSDSGMTDTYVKRRNENLKWDKKNSIYEEITKNTFGVVVYQEQVMEIINRVAGLSWQMADRIRKVIGKKRDAKEFKPYEDAFIQGCQKMKTLSKKEAIEFWEALQSHARYSFNKSHSIAYAIIGYWCCYLKLHNPTEFICAALTYGSENKKEDLIKEAASMGLKIIPPKIGISDAITWVAKEDSLYIPFIEIKGIGDAAARKCGEMKAKTVSFNKGFFWPSQKNDIAPKINNKKIDTLLNKIGAYSKESPEDLSEYFSFKIPTDKPKIHTTLKQLFPAYDGKSNWHTLDFTKPLPGESLIYEKSFVPKKSLTRCGDCSLRKECKAPVPSSPGVFNLAIIGEGPGKEEDEAGKGFVGRSGKMLWDELDFYGLTRTDFHVGNGEKCYPAQSRTPNAEQLKICSEKWLFPELKEINCKLVLAFGNTGLQVFAGKKSGITLASGTTEWCEKANAWICYCVHPSFVLHQDNSENRKLFKDGIANFINKIGLLQPE